MQVFCLPFYDKSNDGRKEEFKLVLIYVVIYLYSSFLTFDLSLYFVCNENIVTVYIYLKKIQKWALIKRYYLRDDLME